LGKTANLGKEHEDQEGSDAKNTDGKGFGNLCLGKKWNVGTRRYLWYLKKRGL